MRHRRGNRIDGTQFGFPPRMGQLVAGSGAARPQIFHGLNVDDRLHDYARASAGRSVVHRFHVPDAGDFNFVANEVFEFRVAREMFLRSVLLYDGVLPAVPVQATFEFDVLQLVAIRRLRRGLKFSRLCLQPQGTAEKAHNNFRSMLHYPTPSFEAIRLYHNPGSCLVIVSPTPICVNPALHRSLELLMVRGPADGATLAPGDSVSWRRYCSPVPGLLRS